MSRTTLSLRDIWPDDYSSAVDDSISFGDVEREVGTMSQWHLWREIWLNGLIVDKDAPFTDLYGYYHPTDDYYSGSYYIPDAYDSIVDTISLDNPPKVMAA